MRKRQSIKSIVLSLILCITMLPLAGITVFAAEPSLLSLTVGGDAIELTDATSYDVTVPVRYVDGVENFVLPAVKATSAEGNTVTVSDDPTVDKANAKATVDVTVSNGTEEATYTINMDLIGLNMYENGGFETGTNEHVGWDPKEGDIYMSTTNASGQFPVGVSTEAAYSGSYGMTSELNAQSASIYYRPEQTLKGGKTYVSSHVAKTASGEATAGSMLFRAVAAEAAAKLNVLFYNGNSGVSYNGSYPNDGQQVWSATFPLAGSWTRLSAVITPSIDTPAHQSMDFWASGVNIHTDDYFLGELVMADFNLSLAGNEVGGYIDTKSGVNSAVTATVTNQLGATVELADKATTTLELMPGAPAGVSLDNGVLNIPAGTEGSITFKATAVPTAKWTNAPQKSFAKEITVELIDNVGKFNPLSALKVGEDVIELKDGVYTYDVTVPVYYENGVDAFVLPEVSAAAKDGFKVDEIATEIDGSTATATVPVEEGEETIKTYTINMNLIGMNMYENGGFETGTNEHIGWEPKAGDIYMSTTNAAGSFPVAVSDKAAYSGSYGMTSELNAQSASIYYRPEQTLKGGKTYVSSHVAKTASGEATTNLMLFRAVAAEADATMNVLFYNGNSSVGYNASNGNGKQQVWSATFPLAGTWTRLSAVITPSIDTPAHQSMDFWASGVNIYTDDYFLGELVMAGFELALDGNVIEEKIATKNGVSSAKITAKAENQIRSTTELADKTEITAIEAVNLPEGVTFEGGNLTIAPNATGTLSFKVTAVSTANWANAPQKTFAKVVSFNLEPDPAAKLKLENLKIGENQIALYNDTYAYTATVPVLYKNGVDAFVLPEVSATAKDGFKAESNTEIDGSTATATVTVKEGDETVETYTITMNLIGVNKYENGGFESGVNNAFYPVGHETMGTFWYQPKDDISNADGKCIELPIAGNGFHYTAHGVDGIGNLDKLGVSVEADKNYLYSMSIRLNEGDERADKNVMLFLNTTSVPFNVKYYNADHSFKEAYTNVISNNSNVYSGIPVTQEWTDVSAVYTPSGDVSRFEPMVMSAPWATSIQDPLPLVDNFFIGELVMADMRLMANDKVVPEILSTEKARELTLSAEVLNQIGTRAGLNNGETTTELLGYVELPENVTLNGNVLYIPAGATGTIVLKARATTTLANAPQSEFVDTITIELVPADGLEAVKENETVKTKLVFTNNEEEAVDTTIFYTVYDKEDTSLVVKKIYSENINVAAGDTISRTKDIAILANEVVKCFFWNKNSINPIFTNTVSE